MASAPPGRSAPDPFATPEASDEEAAAIVAALSTVWPRPGGDAPVAANRWRFSGRWWTKPIPSRRDRPR
ncbi:hypothetical protein BH24ACT3_BH24ACT3_07010 [soil metagenome]